MSSSSETQATTVFATATPPPPANGSTFASRFGSPDEVHPVVIAGAGPAGTMLAFCLAKLGVKPLIVDAHLPSEHEYGRGDAFQCRTIEVMRSLGLGDAMVANGAKMFDRAFWDMTASIPTCTSLNTFFPTELDIEDCYSLGIRQGLVESILSEGVSNLCGVKVLRPWAFQDAWLDDKDPNGPITVTLKSEYGETTRVRARYLVGCDGGKSNVRRMLNERYGVKLEGNSHDSVWSALDVLGTVTDFPDMRKLAIVNGKHGTVMVIPREPIHGKECIRFYCQVTRTNSTAQPSLSDVIAAVHQAFDPFKITWDEVNWFTIYTVGQRIASSFDINQRIFLAGDAAHLHSPKGGLGMNTSLMDAHNLALKIALVEQGVARNEVLATYALERQKVAKLLISMDSELIRLFSEHSKSSGPNRERLAAFQREHFAYQAGTNVTYDSNIMVDAVYHKPSELISSLGGQGLVVGRRLLPANLTRYRDGQPTRILDAVLPFDGHFSIFLCFGDVLSPGRLEQIETLRSFIQRPGGLWQRLIQRYTPDTIPVSMSSVHHPVIRLVGVTTTHHLSLGLSAARDRILPAITASTTPLPVLFESEAFFCDDIPTLSPYQPPSLSNGVEANSTASAPLVPHVLMNPLHQKWDVRPDVGAIVVLRPDGHVGTVTHSLLPLDAIEEQVGWAAVERYFERFLVV